jgi:Molecular chaperone (small heat shock protein)
MKTNYPFNLFYDWESYMLCLTVLRGIAMISNLKNAENLLPSLFNDFWNYHSASSYTEGRAPAISIAETEGGFIVRIMDPILRVEDIRIKAVRNKLEISAKKEMRRTEKDKFIRKEIEHTSFFFRSFTLSQEVDGEKISLTQGDGLIQINLSKKEKKNDAPYSYFY